jgi:Ca-activated chloride channel homolog
MKRLVVPVLALVALVCTLGAQQEAPKPAPAPPPDDTSRIVLEVNRVNLLFTVTDKKGRFITDLTKGDFEVFENKKQQNIMQFTAESDLPLRLAILVDTSNSIRDRFRFQQEAASEFIRVALRPEQDKAMIVSFDSSTELVADLTGNLQQLEKAIQDLRPGGGTSLYDAVFFACRDKLMQDQPMHKFRRAMVILSDGDDNQSRYTRDQALEMAQKGDVVIYTISTNISHVPTDGDKIMKYYAAETGGVAFFPFKAEDLAQSFINVANELRHQYNVYYRPEPLVADGRYHPVSVRVRGRKDLMVHARKGYYAPNL